jgi:hypothetical protein
MKTLFLAFMVLALVSCGKFEEKFGRIHSGQTSVQIQMQNPGAEVLTNGILIYAVNANNPQSRAARFIPDQNAQLNWLIPNGVYNFYAFGYSGANMTSNMYCAVAMNKALSGGGAVIDLALNSVGVCGQAPFGPGNYSNNGDQTVPLNIAVCSPAGGDISATNNSAGCDGGSGRPGPGSAGGLKLHLPEFTRWDPGAPIPEGGGGPSPGIGSGCIPNSFNGVLYNIGIKTPYGTQFPTELELYSDSSCGAYIGSFNMIDGISNAGNNASVRFHDSTNTLVFPGLPMMNSGGVSLSMGYLYLRNY